GFLLAGLGRRLHEGGRVPFGDEDAMPFRGQPLRQQRELGRLARPVDALDDEQLARIVVRVREVVQHRYSLRSPTRRSGPPGPGPLRREATCRSFARTAPPGAAPT